MLPEDCLYRFCFIEGMAEKNEFGRYLGTPDIPVDMAMEKFDELVMDYRSTID